MITSGTLQRSSLWPVCGHDHVRGTRPLMAGEKSYFLHRFVFAQDATSRGDRPIISSSLCAEAAHSSAGIAHAWPAQDSWRDRRAARARRPAGSAATQRLAASRRTMGCACWIWRMCTTTRRPVKVRMLLDEWYERVLSDRHATSDGCAQQVLMDVCTAAICGWQRRPRKRRGMPQDGYGAHRRGGRPHSHAAWKIALSRCATARRASRFLRMSDEYKIDVGHLMRSAALVERPPPIQAHAHRGHRVGVRQSPVDAHPRICARHRGARGKGVHRPCAAICKRWIPRTLCAGRLRRGPIEA